MRYSALQCVTDLLDALLVLDEQLHAGDVDVEAGPLWEALHRGVEATVVLTAPQTHTHTHTHTDPHINIDTRGLFIRRPAPLKHGLLWVLVEAFRIRQNQRSKVNSLMPYH